MIVEEMAKRTLSIELPKGNPLKIVQLVDENGTNRGYLTMIHPNVTKVNLIFENELPDLKLDR